MKLKFVIGLLLLLNAAVLAWQWNAFAPWGWGPDQHREPERMQQQIRPEALKFEVVRPARPDSAASDAPSLEASTPARPTLNPAGPLRPDASGATVPAAQGLPSAAVAPLLPASGAPQPDPKSTP